MTDSLTKELTGDISWRILALDALPEDKFVADMVFISFDAQLFQGSTVAHGVIYNDSRSIFPDGSPIRTSGVKRIFTVGNENFIETRNTIYRVIDKE